MGVKKRLIIFGLIFIILFFGIFSVSAYMHSASDFLIKVGTDTGTLQHAVDGNYFIEIYTYSSPSALDPGHSASEIWVSVKDGEMNLIQALSSTNKLCPASPLKTSYSGPTDKSKVYHYANEIEISSGKSFQDAIDNGELCCVPSTCSNLGYECGTWDDGCGGTLNCGTCGSQASCPSGTCVCNTGWADCNNDNSCECDLTSNQCSAGSCVVTCETHDSMQCYDDDDEYWYDSCGVREEIKQDCGEDYCGGWGEEYCIGEVALQDRICHDLGCSEDACFNVTYTETRELFPDSPGDSKIFCTKLAIEEEADEGKVICTEFYNLGYLDEATYKMDLEYAHSHFSLAAIKGYQAWAIPGVKAMRKNPEETKEYIVPLLNSFMEEVSYRVGKRETGNEVGALFLDRGLSLFERIGVHINEPDWKSLFETQINPLYLNFIESAIGNNFLSTKSLIIGIFQSDTENKYDDLVRNYFTEEKLKEMYYDAKEKSKGSDIEFANALLDNLEEAVEEIESMINSIED